MLHSITMCIYLDMLNFDAICIFLYKNCNAIKLLQHTKVFYSFLQGYQGNVGIRSVEFSSVLSQNLNILSGSGTQLFLVLPLPAYIYTAVYHIHVQYTVHSL